MGGLQCRNSTYKENAKDSWQETWDKNKHYDLVYLIKAGVNKPETYRESMSAIAMAWGREEMEVSANGYGVSLGGDADVLKVDCGDSCILWLY